LTPSKSKPSERRRAPERCLPELSGRFTLRIELAATFGPLRSRYPSDSYFFWSEQDWLAGYRKMQFLGSVFSVLDRTVEKLRQHPQELDRAKIALIEHFVTSDRKDSEIGSLLVGFLGKDGDFAPKFVESYQDYLVCRPAIEGRFRTSRFCWGGETMAEANGEALAIINDVAGNLDVLGIVIVLERTVAQPKIPTKQGVLDPDLLGIGVTRALPGGQQRAVGGARARALDRGIG
jgi:hypothetical protein